MLYAMAAAVEAVTESVSRATEALRRRNDEAARARPIPASPSALTTTLADALRRNDPAMVDFVNELRRQGLVKG